MPFLLQNQSHELLNKEIPDISGKTLHEVSINKEYFLGKVTLINFWSIGCQPCMREIHFLNQLSADYNDRPFQILGIAPHSRQHLLDFLSEKYSPYSNMRKYGSITQIHFELLPEGETSKTSESDTDIHFTITHDCDSLSKIFKVKAYPTNYLVDKEGIIRYVGVGYTNEPDDSKLQQIYREEIEKQLQLE